MSVLLSNNNVEHKRFSHLVAILLCSVFFFLLQSIKIEHLVSGFAEVSFPRKKKFLPLKMFSRNPSIFRNTKSLSLETNATNKTWGNDSVYKMYFCLLWNACCFFFVSILQQSLTNFTHRVTQYNAKETFFWPNAMFHRQTKDCHPENVPSCFTNCCSPQIKQQSEHAIINQTLNY